MKSPQTTMKSSPHSPQLEKAHAQQWRPSTAKINKLINLKKFFKGTERDSCKSSSGPFPGGGSDSEESACSAGDPGSIPESERFPAEGNGNPLQYSCLENSMDRGAWWAIVHGVTKNQTCLSNQHCSLSTLIILFLPDCSQNKSCGQP